MRPPISMRQPVVVVEYDCRGERKQKQFDEPFEARRFFAMKDRAGKNPTVRRPTK